MADTEQASEWWVETLLGSARDTNNEAATCNGRVVAAIQEARHTVGDEVIGDVLTALMHEAEVTGTRISDTRNALNGAAWYWNRIMPVVTQHKRLVAGLGFSVG